MITGLDGNFINGYRVKNNIFISQFIKENENTKSTHTSYKTESSCVTHGICASAPNDRKRLWQLYRHYGAQNGKDVGTDEAQHRYMTERYVNPLARALRELDGNRFDLSHYKPFAEKRKKVLNATTFGDECK